jgi:hypothetical protein
LNALPKVSQSAEYEELVEKRKALLKMFAITNSQHEYQDLSNDQQVMLRDLDQQIADIKERSHLKSDFDDFAQIVYTE